MLLDRPAAEGHPPDAYAVRRTSREDAGRLRDMFSRCSVGTIYERFHSPYASVPGWMTALLVDVGRGEAFVAVAGDEIVGHAMYVRPDGWSDGREAEIAVMVEDAWQSRGVGRGLLREAAGAARNAGVEVFICETLAENRRVAALAEAVFGEVGREVDGALRRIRAPLVGGIT